MARNNWSITLFVAATFALTFFSGCADNTIVGPGGGPSSGASGSTSPTRSAIEANQGAGAGNTGVR